MTEAREHLADWLRDAYAMEMQAVELLERQLDRVENYPTLARRIKEHLSETHGQIAQLETCLSLLGVDRSAVKNLMGKMTGTLTALGPVFATDEILKSSIAAAAFERYEIACYKILAAAADHAGEPEVAAICRRIQAQEEAMAEWLDEHIPETTVAFLTRDAAGLKAKV